MIMAYKSIFDGIIFIEGSEEGCPVLGRIEYKKEGFYNQQLKNLDHVKAQLAEKAKNLGANAVVNFKYGQKNTSWIRSILLSFDDNLNWFASGDAVILNASRYSEIIEELKNR